MTVMVAERTGLSATSSAGARTVRETVDFATPPPGFSDLRRFALAALDDVGCLFALRSVEQPEVRLFVVPPHAYFADYAPRFDASVAETLGLVDTDAVLLVVVHPGRDGGPPTANLLAPMVLNPSTGTAVQVVLDADEWPLRAPLGAAGNAA